ncbi:MFS transporter [Plantibacter flavus]|uniref:MFS transporter n=1 Tax=Plantibacter flavus TaxID=150123 RepID=UPI003F16E91D
MSGSPLTPRTRNPWFVATVAGMASFLDAGAIAGTSTALVLFQEKFALGPVEIGQLSALLTVMIAIGAFTGGRLGDRYGRRRVFIVTMILFAIGALVLTLAVATPMLYVGIILLGFAAGADLPVSMAMIAESAPEGKRGKMITFSHVLWMTGVFAVILIGIFAGGLGDLGARILYGFLFVVAVIVLVLRAGLPESREWTEAKTASTTTGEQFGSLTALFTSRYVVPLIGTGLFYAIANIAANTNGQFSTYLYVNVAGVDVSTASTFNLIAFAFSFGGTFVTMRIVDTKYRMPAFIVASVISVAAFAIPASLGVVSWTLVLMSILYSIGGALAGEPMYKVWSQELFPTTFRSSAQGITIAFTRVVAAAIALVTPQIILGGPQALFAFLITTTIASCLIGILWLARIKRAPATTSIATTALDHDPQPQH